MAVTSGKLSMQHCLVNWFTQVFFSFLQRSEKSTFFSSTWWHAMVNWMGCCGEKIPMTYVVVRLILLIITWYELLLCLVEEVCQPHSANVSCIAVSSPPNIWYTNVSSILASEGMRPHASAYQQLNNMYVLTKLSLGQSLMTASITVKPHFSTGIVEWLKCGPEVMWDILHFRNPTL